MSDHKSFSFEAHITFDRQHAGAVEAVTGSNLWKFSKIDGDPILGKNVYCYLTAHDNDGRVLLARMKYLVELLGEQGVPAVRQKIEQIVFDTATGIDTINA